MPQKNNIGLEETDLKQILQKHLLSLGFRQPLLSKIIDCLILGIKEQAK